VSHRFIDSEADLDLAIKGLLPLSQIPLIAYPELARSTALGLLIGLLTHENLDIVIDAIELIHELTDEDPDAEEDDEGEDDALKALVEALVRPTSSKIMFIIKFSRSKIQPLNSWSTTFRG